MTKYEDILRGHFEKVWGTVGHRIRLSEGPLWELPPGYCVLKFSPQVKNGQARVWRYVTCGMSQPTDQSHLELFMESPQESQRIVELLNMTAHYHRTGQRLGLAHSVNFGSPWLPDSKCEFGVVCLPYLDGPPLENAHILGTEVRILWLLPITKAELEYKKQHGLGALEEAFEKADFNYMDAARPSVV
jgi:hypothetical protein